MLEALDAAAVRRWGRTAAESLELHRAEIDGLNVFPVPDGDTGTNLALTLGAADAALTEATTATPDLSAGAALRALARGAVLGARGNSGVIVAQLLRGLADVAAGAVVCDAAVLVKGLRRGAEQARLAVTDPVEGTVLSVADAAASAAAGAVGLPDVARAALAAAGEALRRTPEQLPVLARAGVVDAGGRGWVIVLDALARTVTGAAAELPAPLPRRHPAAAWRETGSDAYAYEVQYLLHAEPAAVEVLRGELTGLGDSVAVVGTGDGDTDDGAGGTGGSAVWNVHVHVNDVGAAIEAGVAAGRPYRISVVRFADQQADRPGAAAAPGTDVPTGSAVVAVAPGEGLAHLFEAEGVEVVDGGPGRSPSTADVLAAVRATGAGEVVLLPNASQVTGVAEAAADEARAEGVRVAVVPTRSPVQGLSAVAVHDAGRRFDDDVVAMAEAAAATRFAEVTVAQRESLTSVGICQAGDVLGLIDGEVVEIGRGLVAVALALTDRLLGVGVELMTVLVGAEAPPTVGELLRRHVQDRSPLTDVTVYAGGQPHYPLIIGIE